jgi:N-acyl-phosphatidylethanolamine-hydrolysing phospholipase D
MTAPRPAHHVATDQFRNPWLGTAPARFAGLLRWGLQRLVRRSAAGPDRTVFPVVASAFRAPRARADTLAVTWIGHATALVQVAGRNLLTDPMFGERASPMPIFGPRRWVSPGVALDGLPPIDVVLLSHNHYDHFDVGSVRRLAARHPDADWFVPLRLGRAVRACGVERVTELDWWERASAGEFAVTATPAQHFSARGPFDRNRTLWCGFAVQAGDRRIFFAGDTGYHPEFRRIGETLGPFDLALLPVGAYEPRWFMRPVHMNPEEAVRAFADLGGDTHDTMMAAIHWGTFKLTDEPMDEPPARTRAAWRKARLRDDLLWIPRHGETRRV